MKTDRIFVAIQSLVAIVAVAAVTSFAAHGFPDAAAFIAAVPLAVAFGIALLVLGFFNVWLPRGDAVDTTLPVAFAAGIMLNPLFAVGVILLARCATVALRPRGHTFATAIEQIGRRAILISATYAVLGSGVIAGLRSGQPDLRLSLVLGGAAAVFIVLDVLVEQIHAAVRFRAPLSALVVGAIRLQGWMLAAEISTAVLAVFMLPSLQYGGLLVTVGLLLVMRQSFALLLEVRASYTATVEVLARSLEAYDPDRRGHAERVARMCGEAGRAVGLQGKQLESLTYAALFHDVGRLGSDDPDEPPEHPSAEVLASVGFLAGALPILRILDAEGEEEASLDESDLIGAYLVACFSSFDSGISSGRSESGDLAATIGARLYASTRSAVDRVVERVKREARAGSLSAQKLADVVM
jgi:hypothetical protein